MPKAKSNESMELLKLTHTLNTFPLILELKYISELAGWFVLKTDGS